MITRDELDVMAFALRYAIGRKTYAPYIVCKYIQEKIPQMTFEQREQFIREIRRMGEVKEFVDNISANEAYELLRALEEANKNDA